MLRPFAEAATPAFESLGDASSSAAAPCVRATRRSRSCAASRATRPGLAKPLRQFLQTIDDRKRAVEPDPRAAATDPPAPDKTHITGTGGFTGMEAIWNFFYWQTLSTNALDDLGHVLRLGIVVAPCSTYMTQASDELLEDCNQFLGPTQPGVTTPDPTEGAAAAATARGGPGRGTGRRHRSRRRAAGPTGLLDYLLGAMRDARRQLAASPVLIGAVTVLVAIVAVFISYSANQGLPFVPDLQAQRRDPERREARAGQRGASRAASASGWWTTSPSCAAGSGRERSVALLELKLDKQIEPLSVDTRVGVRPRSALGLKYVELVPGRSSRTFETGDTVPLRNAAPTAPELEDVLSTFAPRTRADAQAALVGLRRRLRGPRQPDQHGDPRAAAVPRPPGAGHAQPVRPGHRAAQADPRAGRGRRPGGAGGRGAGAAVR